MTKDDLWMIKRRGALMRARHIWCGDISGGDAQSYVLFGNGGSSVPPKFRRSYAIEVVKDMAMRYSKGEIDDEQVEAEKRVIRAKWMKEQRKLNTVKRRPAATGVTGETKVVKEKAGDTEAEPDRQNEKAQTKARRKSREERVNTPATSVSDRAPVSPPPSPPIWV